MLWKAPGKRTSNVCRPTRRVVYTRLSQRWLDNFHQGGLLDSFPVWERGLLQFVGTVRLLVRVLIQLEELYPSLLYRMFPAYMSSENSSLREHLSLGVVSMRVGGAMAAKSGKRVAWRADRFEAQAGRAGAGGIPAVHRPGGVYRRLPEVCPAARCMSCSRWWETGEPLTVEVEGYTAERLVKERSLTTLSAARAGGRQGHCRA